MARRKGVNMFKVIVVIYMILDLCHSIWIEDFFKRNEDKE